MPRARLYITLTTHFVSPACWRQRPRARDGQARDFRFRREADMRPALSSSSRALIPRARRFCLFAAVVDWCMRAVPHTKSADKGIGIVASPASFRQLIQVHEISAADDYILAFGGQIAF